VRSRQAAVYILTNARRTVLYIGVTNDLVRRVYEHRCDIDPQGFTARYRVHCLVHFESFNDMPTAIRREKQVKGWLRRRKNALVEAANPEWRDLWPSITG
jgi:putative endonuclease